MEQRKRATGTTDLSDSIARLPPDGGVLVFTISWRPRTNTSASEDLADRVTTMSYHPTDAKESCPCGSGKQFAICCQSLPYWHPVCPNPGMQGYGLMCPQSARFTTIPATAIYTFLQDDKRFHCIEDTPQRAFWTYWGDPVINIPQGRLCFGDIELLERRTLLITALSDTRMQTLLEFMRPFNLGAPQIQREPLPLLPKKPIRKVPARKRQRKF